MPAKTFPKRGEAGHEEQPLRSLLSTLVREYDERGEPLPDGKAVDVLKFLMEPRALRPVDLTPDLRRALHRLSDSER